MKKRFISLIITFAAVLCIFAIFPGTSFAETEFVDFDPNMFDGGNGTEKSPYEIATLEQMEYFASITKEQLFLFAADNDLYFKLTADIGSEENPIKTCISAFGEITNDSMRYFDGNGRTVYVDIEYKDGELDEERNIGLFSECASASITNLVIEGRIDAGSYDKVGGVCGTARYNVIISDCVNNAVITGNSSVGGICGYADDITISYCMNNAKITGNSYAGGICGRVLSESGGIIDNCWNTGRVIVNEKCAGGICGDFTGDCINYSNNKAMVSGKSVIGGICGRFSGNLMNCCSAHGGVKSIRSDECGLLCGEIRSNSEMIKCCAEQSGTRLIAHNMNRVKHIDDSVAIILPGKFAFEFPRTLEEAKALKDCCVFEAVEDYYRVNGTIEDRNGFFIFPPSEESLLNERTNQCNVDDNEVVELLLHSAVIRGTFAELGFVVERGDESEIWTKITDVYPIWIEQIQAIKEAPDDFRNYEEANIVVGDSEQVALPIVVYALENPIIQEAFTKLVLTEKLGTDEEILSCVNEIYPDIVAVLNESIQMHYSGAGMGTALSNGSLAIICGVAGLAAGFLAGIIFRKKKNVPAFDENNDAESTEKDDES